MQKLGQSSMTVKQPPPYYRSPGSSTVCILGRGAMGTVTQMQVTSPCRGDVRLAPGRKPLIQLSAYHCEWMLTSIVILLIVQIKLLQVFSRISCNCKLNVGDLLALLGVVFLCLPVLCQCVCHRRVSMSAKRALQVLTKHTRLLSIASLVEMSV